MSGELFQRYGAIVDEDVEVLEACLRQAMVRSVGALIKDERPILRVLEIGMHDGGTAKGIERFANDRDFHLEYVGIDPDDGTTRPRHVPAGGKVIVGDSAEVFEQVSGEFDLVWVDGCHCCGHVILDTVYYSRLVRPGGFILFHDANPRGQGKGHQYHGPDTSAFGLAVSLAHALLGWPFAGWVEFARNSPDDRDDCGTVAYRRTA